MRLDLLLKQSGLIKRRTIAKEFCLHGLVEINGKIQKPSYEVKDNDLMEIRFGEKIVSVAITFEQNGKKTIIHLDQIGLNSDGEGNA